MVGKRTSSAENEGDSTSSDVISDHRSDTGNSSSDEASDMEQTDRQVLNKGENKRDGDKSLNKGNPVKAPGKAKRKRKGGSHKNKMLKMAQKLRDIRANETPKEREARLLDMRERARKRMQCEDTEQKCEGLSRLRDLTKTSSAEAESDSTSDVVSSVQSVPERSSSYKASDVEKINKKVKADAAKTVKKINPNKSAVKTRRRRKAASHTARMLKMAKKLRDIRAKETPKEREARLLDMRERAHKRIQCETADQRSERLARLRELQKSRSAKSAKSNKKKIES